MSGPTLLNQNTQSGSVAARYAVRGNTLKGSALVQQMALSPAYAAPVQASPAIVTESTTARTGNTKNIGYTNSLFRWSAALNTSGGAANPRGSTYADGTGFHGSVPYASMAFDYDQQYFDILYKPLSGIQYRIWVNEQAHSASMVNVVTTGASQAYLQVDLGAATSGVNRRIVVEFVSESGSITFYGVYCPPTASVVPPAIASPRVMIVGDSYDLGIGASSKAYGYSTTLGRMMGWADTWTCMFGVASTGLIQGVNTKDTNYITRLQPDVIANNPDLVIIQGSLNDNPHVGKQLIGPALATYVNTLRAAIPNVTVVVTSPMYAGSPPASYLQVRDELKTAAAQLGVPFVDLFNPVSFTGSGNTTAPTGAGNSDYYLGGANDPSHLHPSDAGHYYLASVLKPRLAAALGLAV
jgi:lysophospholipase L1-like esterase